jgi:hypothetical protein
MKQTVHRHFQGAWRNKKDNGSRTILRGMQPSWASRGTTLMPEAYGSNDKKASFSAITKAKMALEHAPTSADNQDKNPELHNSHKFLLVLQLVIH